ncbi:hypothetical protein [Glycomyces salinus]|uniref:hypothetical protein n=1 Tax=Glycomyces salinus TaxID=980294 RepID=UPI0018EC9A84|nr:hypothetical protein [Glycomyces salinus]
MTTTEAEPQPGAKINIGEFKLGIGDDGAHYRVYAETEADSASLLRVHPDPESKKRTVATGLDSGQPRFALPSNWSASEIDKAKTEITNLWKVHKRG